MKYLFCFYITDIPSDTNKPDDDWSSPASAGQISSAVRLFEDDDDNEDLDDSDIFGPKTTIAPIISSSIANEPEMDKISEPKIPNTEEAKQKQKSPTIEKKLPASSVLGLFDDDDDADSDLFGSKFVAKSSNVSKDQSVNEKPQQPKSMPTSSTTAKISLFGDHDDGDDLFGGGPPPLPEPIKQSQPKRVNQKKIFSDDSSDDDLFGGGKKVAQKNPPKSSSGSTSTASTIPKTAKITKASEKLFSDSEDDDLFGGSKTKSTG